MNFEIQSQRLANEADAKSAQITSSEQRLAKRTSTFQQDTQLVKGIELVITRLQHDEQPDQLAAAAEPGQGNETETGTAAQTQTALTVLQSKRQTYVQAAAETRGRIEQVRSVNRRVAWATGGDQKGARACSR